MRRLLPAILVGVLLALAALAQAEVVQKGVIRVFFAGRITPHTLPRQGTAPIKVSLSGHVLTTSEGNHPQLRRIKIALNRYGQLDYRGLPVCHYRQITPASSQEALEACRGALVGTGTFGANVLLPEQSPFPSDGKIYAFNGKVHGKPVIFAHIYGTEPLPQSFVLPFELKQGSGAYGATLVATLPHIAADWGFVNLISLKLKRNFRYRGQPHSYLSAGCPTPADLKVGIFSFAKASFSFADGRTLSSVLTRTCRARG